MSTALATVHDGELVPRDEGLTMVTTPDEARRRLDQLQTFVRSVMREGEDYGTIPGCGPKPSLFKPGAEKLSEIYGLVPSYSVEEKAVDWAQGFVLYVTRCTLRRGDRVVAECIGTCNSRERKYAKQSAYDVANTVLKMAQKRAFVGAVISSTRSSGIFTQDLEDMRDERRQVSREPPKEDPKDWYKELGTQLTEAKLADIKAIKSKMAWAKKQGHLTDEQFDELVTVGKNKVDTLTRAEDTEPPATDEPREPGSDG